MTRRNRLCRWLMLVSTAGMLPAFLLNCDSAALNFQRGLWQGLGEDAGDILLTQINLFMPENS